MKKLFIAIIMLLFAAPVFGQNAMKFALSTGPKGETDWPFTTISFVKDKPVKCCVYLNQKFTDVSTVTFKIFYRQDDSQPFIERTSYKQEVKPEWGYFYYNLTFDIPGSYKVSVVDSRNNPVSEGILRLVP